MNIFWGLITYTFGTLTENFGSFDKYFFHDKTYHILMTQMLALVTNAYFLSKDFTFLHRWRWLLVHATPVCTLICFMSIEGYKSRN